MKKSFKIVAVILVVLIVGGYFAVEFTAESFVKAELDKFARKNKSLGEFKYSEVDVRLSSFELEVKGIELKPVRAKYPVIIDSVIIPFSTVPPILKFKEGKSDVLEALEVAVKGIHIDAKQLGAQGKGLLDLGYETLLADVGLNFAYDNTKKELQLNDLSYGAKTAGFVNIKFHMSELDLSNLNILSLMFAIPKINLHSASFKYSNDSLFEKMIKSTAKKKGITPEQALVKIEAEIDAKIAQAKDEFSKKALTTMKQFVRNPKKISITASPSEKVSFQTIKDTKDPLDLVKLLDIKVEL